MSVYKRPKGRKGRWHFRIRIDGVRYRGALKTARLKSEAEEDEREIIRQIRRGEYGKATHRSKNFKEFAEKVYMSEAMESQKKSLRIDRSRLKPLVDSFGRRRLPEINKFLIERYKKQRKATPIVYHRGGETWEKPRSVAAINRELWLLSAILTLAMTKGEISKNPFLGGRKRREVQPLKGEVKRVRYLLPEEEGRLMTTLTGQRSHLCAIVTLAINTGLRVNELFGLKREDVDFHRDVLYIKHTKTDEDREVPLNDTARELLSELMQADRKGGEFLFTNPKTGTRYTTIKTAWLTACRNAGLSNLRFHDLRHTFGTRAADAGVPLPAIRDVMGHRSIQTTERYAHATDEGKRRAVEAIHSQSKKIVTELSQRKIANR